DQTGKKFSIAPKPEDASKEKIIQWKDTEIGLVKAALDKNEIRIKTAKRAINTETHTNLLTDETIKHYLNGESIIRIWQTSQPENHQRFSELVASIEDELKEWCILSVVEPNTFVEEIRSYAEEKI